MKIQLRGGNYISVCDSSCLDLRHGAKLQLTGDDEVILVTVHVPWYARLWRWVRRRSRW